MFFTPPPKYPSQSISWKHIDQAINIERKVIDILQSPVYFFRWLDEQVYWLLSERGRMKKKRVRSTDEIEQGKIYYNRHPDPDIAAFCVFYQKWFEWDNEYCIYYIYITESSLIGKGNTEWVKRRIADEMGWMYETDYLSYDSNKWTIPEGIDFDEIDDWVDKNIPPGERLVLADLGLNGIKPSLDTVTTEEQIQEDIEKRNLYAVLDAEILEMLESYGLYNEYNRWQQRFEEDGSDED